MPPAYFVAAESNLERREPAYGRRRIDEAFSAPANTNEIPTRMGRPGKWLPDRRDIAGSSPAGTTFSEALRTSAWAYLAPIVIENDAAVHHDGLAAQPRQVDADMAQTRDDWFSEARARQRHWRNVRDRTQRRFTEHTGISARAPPTP